MCGELTKSPSRYFGTQAWKMTQAGLVVLARLHHNKLCWHVQPAAQQRWFVIMEDAFDDL